MSLVKHFDEMIATIPGTNNNKLVHKFREKLVNTDNLFNPKDPTDMCLAYIAITDGFEGVKTDSHSIKITSPYIAGNLMYWPTTNRFRFSSIDEAKKYSWPSEQMSIASLLLSIRCHWNSESN